MLFQSELVLLRTFHYSEYLHSIPLHVSVGGQREGTVVTESIPKLINKFNALQDKFFFIFLGIISISHHDLFCSATLIK